MIDCFPVTIGVGRIRAFPIDDTAEMTLLSAIKSNVQSGSTVYTDDHRGYMNLKNYDHQTINHSLRQYSRGIITTNGIESVWAVLKRSYMGIFHHISFKHLSKYVNECCFRLNGGQMEALIQMMQGRRLTYKSLIQ